MAHPESLTPAERRKRWLKKLAAERAGAWRVSVLHPLLDGKTRIETKREVLELEDGVCVAWFPRDASFTAGSSTLVGTRVVGWVTAEGKLVNEPLEGGRMLMWRGGAQGTATLALLAPMRTLEPVVPLTIFNEPPSSRDSAPTSSTMRCAREWADVVDVEATRHEGRARRRAG